MHFETKEALIEYLKRHKIPVETWGTGQAKTIDHLLNELRCGERTLEETSAGLRSIAYGVSINTYYRDESGVLWILKEDRQEFLDGRVRTGRNVACPAEKLKPEEREDVLEAVYRAFSEELGITDRAALNPIAISDGYIVKKPDETITYPGLPSEYRLYWFKVFLPRHLYKPDGYIEKQKDKTNYYRWRECSEEERPAA